MPLCHVPGERMDLDVFIDHLDRFAYADEVLDAAEELTGERSRSKAAALDDIATSLQRAANAEPLKVILECLYADTLRSWSRVACGEGLPRDDAVAALARAYRNNRVASLDEEDELDDDAFEDERFEDAKARGARHRSPGHRAAFEREMARTSEAADRRLRDYQRDAIDWSLPRLRPGVRLLVQIATGGGKTLVATDLIERWLGERGGPVLWVTKGWPLLFQACREIRNRHRIHVARLGGDGTVLHPLPDEDVPGVIFTTLHTLSSRVSSGDIRRMRPTLAIWDECHWAVDAQLGRRFLQSCDRLGVPLLGLTATPKESSDRFPKPYFTKSFKELVDEGVLARPVLPPETVGTGVQWRPEMLRDGFDFTPGSLRMLGSSVSRNEVIVGRYRQHVDRYGKTLVFACNIQHAEALAQAFERGGISARPVHSRRSAEWNADALRAFRDGAIRVLVGVEMLTHGIDVPDARTAFLCRPTSSEILFAQMIGRLARRADGKDRFHIVEFTDNCARLGGFIIRSKAYFAGCGVRAEDETSTTCGPVEKPRWRGTFDPNGATRWVPDSELYAPEARGLWYRDGQSFGIELELAAERDVGRPGDPRWNAGAEALHRALVSGVGDHAYDKYVESNETPLAAKDLWVVKYDGSCGFEVSSRPLVGLAGMMEVVKACAALRGVAAWHRLRADHSTGCHVHLGWKASPEVLRRAARIAHLFEPALATLVPPSRIAAFDGVRYDVSQPNRYTKPISSVVSEPLLARIGDVADVERLLDREHRYVTLNLAALTHHETVEVRMHGGTLSASKLLLWVSLWQQLLWAAGVHASLPTIAESRTTIDPSGDVVALAETWLPDGRQPEQRRLIARLADRRAEIVEQWRAASSLDRWLAYASTWRTPPV